MKAWKLVSGILSCVLFFIVIFQSCAASVVDAMEENDGTSGGSGMLVAILMLTGGIVSIASRKSYKNGGNIALIIMFGLAALVGYTGYGVYSDLIVWSTWCLINAVVALLAIITKSGEKAYQEDYAVWEQQNAAWQQQNMMMQQNMAMQQNMMMQQQGPQNQMWQDQNMQK